MNALWVRKQHQCLFFLTVFIVLHTLEGFEIAINVEQITPITRGKDGEANKLLTERVACVIGLSDRRFISVLDDCADVLRKISDLERQEERP